jgi:hypothetical protein
MDFTNTRSKEKRNIPDSSDSSPEKERKNNWFSLGLGPIHLVRKMQGCLLRPRFTIHQFFPATKHFNMSFGIWDHEALRNVASATFRTQ